MRAVKPSAIALAVALAPGMASAVDFSGGYVGGSAGILSSAQVKMEDDPLVVNGAIDDAGLTKFDVLVGFGQQYGQFYVGGELTYTLSNNLDGTAYSASGSQLDYEAQDGWSLGARFGLSHGDWVGYGKVAYGSRTFEQTVTEPAGSVSGDETFSGPGVGFGAEYMINRDVSVRAEAMRFDYSSESYDDGTSYDPSEHSIDIGAVYRF